MTALIVTLVVCGLLLVVIEVLVIPGFGIFGVLGAAAILGAGVIAYTQLGLWPGLLAVAGGASLAALLFWVLPKTRLGRSMVLATRHEETAPDRRMKRLEGQSGVAMTDLRPSGTAEIDGHPVDVVSDGRYIQAGTRLRVERVQGMRVVVEPLDSTDTPNSEDEL